MSLLSQCNFLIYRRKNKKAVIAGWPASGSTFLYQVCKKLELDVKKVHGGWSKKPNIIIFFTIRDPRDVIISNARRTSWDLWNSEGAEKAIKAELNKFLARGYIEDLYKSISLNNVFLIRYENYIFKNEEIIIKMIADQFLIPLTKKKIENILEETSIKTNLERSKKYKKFDNYDKETFIHGRHISNKGKIGGWKDFFSQDVVAEVKEKIGQLLIDLGYEKDFDWN